MVSDDRLDWLDSLRGLAAILVMIYHLWSTACRQFPPLARSSFAQFTNFFVLEVTDFGKIGIVLFFAISGFVIPSSILKHPTQRVSRFIVNRFFRLYPLYWVSAAFAVLMSASGIVTSQILANLTMVAPLFGQADLVGVYWTLQIELLFYIVCAVLAGAGRLGDLGIRYASIFVWLLIAVFFSWLRYWLERKVPVAVPLALSVMFIGCCWRDYLVAGLVSRTSLAWAIAAFLVTLLPICMLAYQRDFGNEETWWRYFLSWSLGVGLFLVLTTRIRLRQRAFVKLGLISYSIYLLHPLIGIPIIHFMAKQDSLSLGMAYGSMLLGGAASIVVAAATYWLIEGPGIRLGRSITRRVYVLTWQSPTS